MAQAFDKLLKKVSPDVTLTPRQRNYLLHNEPEIPWLMGQSVGGSPDADAAFADVLQRAMADRLHLQAPATLKRPSKQPKKEWLYLKLPKPELKHGEYIQHMPEKFKAAKVSYFKRLLEVLPKSQTTIREFCQQQVDDPERPIPGLFGRYMDDANVEREYLPPNEGFFYRAMATDHNAWREYEQYYFLLNPDKAGGCAFTDTAEFRARGTQREEDVPPMENDLHLV